MAGNAEIAVFLQLQHLTAVESALNSQTQKNQALEQDKERLLKETSDRDQKVRLFLRVYFQQQSIVSNIYAETCFVFVAADKSSGISSQIRSPDRAAQLSDLDYVARKGCSRSGGSHTSEDAATVSGKGQQRSLYYLQSFSNNKK